MYYKLDSKKNKINSSYFFFHFKPNLKRKNTIIAIEKNRNKSSNSMPQSIT